MNNRIKVSYYNKLDTKLDKKIISLIETLGYKWYGQGFNFEKNKREIFFSKTSNK